MNWKKIVSVGIFIVVLIGVSTLSYKIVDSIKGEEVSRKIEIAEDKKDNDEKEKNKTEDEGKNTSVSGGRVETEKKDLETENSEEVDRSTDIEIEKDDNISYEKLNFTTYSNFIKSYNELVSDIGYDASVIEAHSEKYRAFLKFYEVGNVRVITYPDGDLIQVVIEGELISDKIGGLVGDANVTIKESDGGNTIIDVNYN